MGKIWGSSSGSFLLDLQHWCRLPVAFMWKLFVRRVYVPRFFVSSQQRFGALRSWTNRVIALRQISVTALFYLEDSRRIHPRSVRACQPKHKRMEECGGREGVRERESARARTRERESSWESTLLLLLYVFFPPPGPALCKLGLARSAVCSAWSLHSGPQTFLVF